MRPCRHSLRARLPSPPMAARRHTLVASGRTRRWQVPHVMCSGGWSQVRSRMTGAGMSRGTVMEPCAARSTQRLGGLGGRGRGQRGRGMRRWQSQLTRGRYQTDVDELWVVAHAALICNTHTHTQPHTHSNMSSIRPPAEEEALVEAVGRCKSSEHLVIGPWRDVAALPTVRLETCFARRRRGQRGHAARRGEARRVQRVHAGSPRAPVFAVPRSPFCPILFILFLVGG